VAHVRAVGRWVAHRPPTNKSLGEAFLDISKLFNVFN